MNEFRPGSLPPQGDTGPAQQRSSQSGQNRARWLAELQADQHRCWTQGKPFLVETYLARHPELQADTEGILELISHEVVLREQHGDKPSLDEYQRRFPQYVTMLQRRLGWLDFFFGRCFLVVGSLTCPRNYLKIGR